MSSANVFENQINIRELADVVSFGARHNVAVMVFGGPGLGKSQKIKQLANDMFGERADNLIDVRLSDKEPSDVVGLPIPVVDENTGKVRTVFATPSFWPTDENWKGIILLDELTNAYPSLQQAAYQIMLDHTIGEYNFPAGAVFVGAGNRDGDGGATSTLLAPLANRMIIVEVNYDSEIWLQDYAIPKGLHSSLIGFIKAKPTAIYNYEEAEKSGSVSYSTPRSLEFGGSNVLFDLDKGLINDVLAGILLQGSISKGLADELLTYHTRSKELPAIADIMNGIVTDHKLSSDKVDLLYIIGAQGTAYLRKEMADHTIEDDQILDHAANFMTFMQKNYEDTNKDFVTSVFMAFTQKTGLGSAVLIDGIRAKMIPRMMAKHPSVQQIVISYNKDYAQLVSEAEKAA